MDEHSSITGTSSMARTSCMPGMECFYPAAVFRSWLEHLRRNLMHSTAFFVRQQSDKNCGERQGIQNNHIVSGQTMLSFKRRLDKLVAEDERWNY